MHTIIICHTNLLKTGAGWEWSFHSAVTEVSIFLKVVSDLKTSVSNYPVTKCHTPE
jgi:hypothetical protein